jgi:hypothetical protein
LRSVGTIAACIGLACSFVNCCCSSPWTLHGWDDSRVAERGGIGNDRHNGPMRIIRLFLRPPLNGVSQSILNDILAIQLVSLK